MSGARLVLADDDVLARSALAELLSAEPDLGTSPSAGARSSCASACTPPAALVLLADSLEPGTDYRVCSESARSAPVLVLARGRAETALLPALEAGALGVVTAPRRTPSCWPPSGPRCGGRPVCPPGMLGSLLRDLIERRRRDDQALARYRRLTARERHVLRLLARGADVNDMASELVLSPQTIRSHLQHVLDKLEVHSRAEAVELRPRPRPARRNPGGTAVTDDRRPMQVAGATVSGRGSEPVLVESGRSLGLNETALAIWDLCDGRTTVDEMVDAVVELTGLDVEQVGRDVVGVIEEFRSLGLVTFGH